MRERMGIAKRDSWGNSRDEGKNREGEKKEVENRVRVRVCEI